MVHRRIDKLAVAPLGFRRTGRDGLAGRALQLAKLDVYSKRGSPEARIEKWLASCSTTSLSRCNENKSATMALRAVPLRAMLQVGSLGVSPILSRQYCQQILDELPTDSRHRSTLKGGCQTQRGESPHADAYRKAGLRQFPDWNVRGCAIYSQRAYRWAQGSRLVIFSDGLTDAQNAEEEEFGDERVIECCKSIPAGIDAKAVAEHVMRAAAEWSVGTEQFDDTTVVVMDVAIEAYPRH